MAALLENFGEQVFHRPDYGVRVDKLISGHIELKRPGTSLDPTTYGRSTHNGRQWRRLRNLPNLRHINGLQWRLWRYVELVGSPVHLDAASLATHKRRLTALIYLEKKQRELLHAVVEGDPLSRDKLEADGVCWPKTNRDRVPKYLLEEGDDFFVTQ